MDKKRKRLNRRLRRVKKILHIYSMYGNRCQHCLMESYDVGFFDFHHINPDEKEVTIGKIIDHSKEKIQAELEKCLMLCPNCHRNEHIRMREEEYINEYEHGIPDSRMG